MRQLRKSGRVEVAGHLLNAAGTHPLTSSRSMPSAPCREHIKVNEVNSPRPGQQAGINPVLAILLAGILLALLALIGLLLFQARGGRNEGDQVSTAAPSAAPAKVAVAPGQTVERRALPKPREDPKPIGDPDRIRQALRVGGVYHSVLKAGMTARVEDKSWGLTEVVSMAYAAELQIDRTIESNDGKRGVELRHFVSSRNLKRSSPWSPARGRAGLSSYLSTTPATAAISSRPNGSRPR